MKTEILGVEIDDIGEAEVLEKIKSGLTAGKRFFIATPNPEMLVAAYRDLEFKKTLNAADIKIADGAGLKFGAKILGHGLKNRVTGVDLMGWLCELAANNGLNIYLLGGEAASVKQASENFKKKYSGLKIVGAESGGEWPARRGFGCHKAEAERRFYGGMRGGQEWNNRVIIEHINAVKPDMLFVALGHGKQEKWIFENYKKLPSVKLAMGVGGAFDFISGKIRRAPLWMRRAGLEWFWRLILEPQRIGRIFNATIVFIWLCIKKKK